MITLLGAFGLGIIGQTGRMSLAVVRSPGFLPEGVNAALFESHWYWWLALGVLVLALLWLGVSRQQKPLTMTGLVAGVVLGLWVFLAAIIVTPAERLYAAHEAVLSAASAGDAKGVVARLAPDFGWGPVDRTMMAASIETALNTYHVRSNLVRHYKSVVQGREAESQVNIFTQTDMGPVITKWDLQWHDEPGGDWQVTAVQEAGFGTGEEMKTLNPSLTPSF